MRHAGPSRRAKVKSADIPIAANRRRKLNFESGPDTLRRASASRDLVAFVLDETRKRWRISGTIATMKAHDVPGTTGATNSSNLLATSTTARANADATSAAAAVRPLPLSCEGTPSSSADEIDSCMAVLPLRPFFDSVSMSKALLSAQTVLLPWNQRDSGDDRSIAPRPAKYSAMTTRSSSSH